MYIAGNMKRLLAKEYTLKPAKRRGGSVFWKYIVPMMRIEVSRYMIVHLNALQLVHTHEKAETKVDDWKVKGRDPFCILHCSSFESCQTLYCIVLIASSMTGSSKDRPI